MAAPIFKCSVSVYNSSLCDYSSLHPSERELIRLKDCRRDISSHITKIGIGSSLRATGETRIQNEAELICKRIGLFTVEGDFTVCPHHRYSLGIHWRPKISCQYPKHQGNAKPYRSFEAAMSKRVVSEFGILVQIGSGICRKCYGDYLNLPAPQVHMPVHAEETPHNLMVEEPHDEVWTCRLRTRMKDSSTADSCSQLTDSQTSDECRPTDSQGSNWSQGEEAETVKLKEIQLADVNMAIEIIGRGQISPLRSKLHTDLMNAKDRTVRYYKRKADVTCTALYEAIAPCQGEKLKRMSTHNLETTDDDLFQVVGEMFNNLKDSDVKCQLLSLVVNKHSKAELLAQFPQVTKYQIDKARRHAYANGPGTIKQSATIQHRQRMNYAKLQHAVEFFSDPTFNQISSYTTRDLKLDSGETLVIPDVVRTVIHSNLIKLYNSYCSDNNVEPLSDSTLYEVLKACGASRRKCLRGLDNIAVDGSCAYDSLISLVDKFDKPQEWKKDMKNKFLNSRLYLKTDYRLHIQMEDECAFHCLQYALSDPKNVLLSVACCHQRKKVCSRCNLFGETVAEVRSHIAMLPIQEQEILQQDLEMSIVQVEDWRSHILRTVNQDSARLDVLNDLKSNEVLLIMDWAMKYLPHIYREKMKDFFGQKGVHWHVCVAVFKDPSGNLVHKTFTHIMDHAKQDFFAVLSLLEHTMSTLKQQLPHLTEAYLRSDNAGCYHCGQLWLSIPSLSERTGIHVKRYDYSEAQSGKSYCDSKIAHMRSKMRIFASEGNNISTALHMKTAIDSGAGVKGVYTAVVNVDTSKQDIITHSWKGVSLISNLEFTSCGIKTWRAYKVGNGCFRDKESLEMLGKKQAATRVNVLCGFNENEEQIGNIFVKSANNITESDALTRRPAPVSSQEESSDMADNLFHCPEYGCLKSYQTFQSLNEHLLVGRHVQESQGESSIDKTKRLWAEKCESLLAPVHRTVNVTSESSGCIRVPCKGWALKKDKKFTRFSQNVKTFLTDLFHRGEQSGIKETPVSVALEMRSLMESGARKFSPSEWLQPSQIASFFSRLATKLGKANVSAEKYETENDNDCLAVLSELHSQEVFDNLTI